MRNLLELKSNELKSFLDSFDTIITDCDGVLWLGNVPIEKSLEVLKKLQSLGKKIVFVSNNSSITPDQYCRKFQKLGFPAHADQIAIPSKVVAWYLKKLKFTGKAYVVSTHTFHQVLEAEGINVVKSCLEELEETPEGVLKIYKSDPEIKAVILDIDVNVTWLKISKSIYYLENRDVLYLVGALDHRVPIAKDRTMLGSAGFANIISNETNREPILCAKPSTIMKNYIVESFELDNPSKCLFIGDSFENDMKFADLCGFAKLWVASGIDKLESVTSDKRKSTDNDYSLPDYYLPSLGHLLNMLNT